VIQKLKVLSSVCANNNNRASRYSNEELAYFKAIMWVAVIELH
jgi:hypothetical protein